nr:arginine--tRNA ligase [Oceanococcus sp. HetDA_MAG_MS8]
MKDALQDLLNQAFAAINLSPPAQARIENTRDKAHGDLAANHALVGAKQAGCAPRELAQRLIDNLPSSELVRQVDIAGPGFLNFFLASDARTQVLREIHDQGSRYGHAAPTGTKVLVEFVSANPTGPLHVGHGRGAAYGDCLVRLLRAAGNHVDAEYYVNDAGRQIDILATSVWLRYLQQHGQELSFPRKAYQGDYIGASAERLSQKHAQSLVADLNGYFEQRDIPADDDEHGDAHLDALISAAKALLGADAYRLVLDHILQEQLADIKTDLEGFRVHFEAWASERAVVEDGSAEAALKTLDAAGLTYRQDGALWFASTQFGDDKDRVLLRANGAATYFANDIAYHQQKIGRGYDRLIDVWGADHHGYVPRMKAAVQALTGQADKLDVQLVQFVSLLRDGEKVSMSTRAGTYETLEDLREEVGVDAARFFYVMRSNDQTLEFDLALATQQSADNPVYYLQYAHARVCSVLSQATQRFPQDPEATQAGLQQLDALGDDTENALLNLLGRFPETIQASARQLGPQIIVHYLREVAEGFHRWYNAVPFLVDDAAQRQARLCLAAGVATVLRNGLDLLGVAAPERM